MQSKFFQLNYQLLKKGDADMTSASVAKGRSSSPNAAGVLCFVLFVNSQKCKRALPYTLPL